MLVFRTVEFSLPVITDPLDLRGWPVVDDISDANESAERAADERVKQLLREGAL